MVFLGQCISISFTIKKIHQQVQPTTLVLKYMHKFSSFVTILLCQKYIQVFQILLDFLK
jgi:hypothetical protein